MHRLLSEIKSDSSLDFTDHASRAAYIQDFIQYSLWGNQSDLSLNLHSHQLEGMQDAISTHHSEKTNNLIINDLDKVVKLLANSNGVRIDIVLDNSAFELFVDLLLADFLLESGIASKVVFHAKEYPYFVSDVTIPDFNFTVEAVIDICKAESWANKIKWNTYIEQGKWSVECDPFWTLSYPFQDIDRAFQANSTYGSSWDKLKRQDSKLVIFKGDLNYRKLVNDVNGDCSFKDAIGTLANSGPSLLALRTCKSQPLAGITKEMGLELDSKDVDWRISGKWGIIQIFEN